MSKLSPLKIQIFSIILALITASIACNHPDAVQAIVESAVEKCISVSSSEYESTAARLGHPAEMPKYPEGATYEVCYVNGEASSVRMTDGHMTEDNEVTESEEANSLSPSTGTDESISGTYVGTSNYPEVLGDLFGSGQYTINKLDVSVADDGTVSGYYSVYFIGDSFTINWKEEECTGHWEIDMSGTFFGKLTDSQGKIESEESWVCTDNSNCVDYWDVCSTDKPFYREFDIQINGGYMTGTALTREWDNEVNLDWIFNAAKK